MHAYRTDKNVMNPCRRHHNFFFFAVIFFYSRYQILWSMHEIGIQCDLYKIDFLARTVFFIFHRSRSVSSSFDLLSI